MKLLLATLLSLSTLSTFAGQVEVRFTKPDEYRDAGRSAREREHTTETLGRYLKSLGASLPDGQTLRIEVKDIDLAGTPKWTTRGDLRVLRGGADWPRIDLAWSLEADGRTLQQGDESIADLDYQRAVPPKTDGNELPYEKQMLARWFGQRFNVTAPH